MTEAPTGNGEDRMNEGPAEGDGATERGAQEGQPQPQQQPYPPQQGQPYPPQQQPGQPPYQQPAYQQPQYQQPPYGQPSPQQYYQQPPGAPGQPGQPGQPGGPHQMPPQAPLPPEFQQYWAAQQPPAVPPEQAKYRVPWSALDVFAVIGLVIVFGLIIFSAFGAVLSMVTYSITGQQMDSTSIANSPLINTIFWFLQWAVTLGVALTYFKIRGYQFNLKTFGFRKTPLWTAIWLTIVVRILAGIGEIIYSQFVTPQQETVTEMFGMSVISFIVSLIVVALLTPVVEEMFFRGIIHQGLEQQLGFWPGALLSASIFALAHLDLTIFVPIFMLGFGFAYLMHRTHSLWPGIFGHFIVNSVAVIAQFISANQS